MKRVIALPVAVCLTVALSAQTRQINPRAYIEHVRFLASDQLEGRGNGTPGLDAGRPPPWARISTTRSWR